VDTNPTVDELRMNEIRRLDAAAVTSASGDARQAFDAIPWLSRSIAEDAASGRFARWSRSTIIDENVGNPVLDRAVFDRLHDLAGEPSAWPVGNAGVLHVYGYLLSLTPTPYGLKRERWLGPELARAFGLADDAFAPWSDGPTLLERVTGAATGLLHSPAASRTEAGGEYVTALSASAGRAALVYARVTEDGIRLVTTFPVADAAAVLTAIDAAAPTPGAPSRPRWNAAP
jgi:hypothetical protein